MKISCEVTPSSLSRFQSSLLMTVEKERAQAIAGMDAAAAHVFDDAQKLVPRQTNALANSGHITSEDGEVLLRRIIGYGTSLRNPETGKPTSSYAVYKHETAKEGHMEGYKWLERALLAYGREGFMTSLAEHLRMSF